MSEQQSLLSSVLALILIHGLQRSLFNVPGVIGGSGGTLRSSNAVCNPVIIQHLSKFFYLFLSFLGPHPWHMELPRLRVKLEV